MNRAMAFPMLAVLMLSPFTSGSSFPLNHCMTSPAVIGKTMAAPMAKSTLVASNWIIFEQKGVRTPVATRKNPMVKVFLNPILLAITPTGIAKAAMNNETIEVAQLTVALSIP